MIIFKKKAGNESQIFKIHFRVKYLPITIEEEEETSSWDDENSDEEDWVQFAIEHNFEDEIDRFIGYIQRVADHIISCEEIYENQNIDSEDCLNGELEAFYEEWVEDHVLQMSEPDKWKKYNIISNNSRIVIDFPETVVGVEGVEAYAEPVEVKGYLEVKLNINTIGFNLSDFQNYIEFVIVYGYKKWIWDNPNIDYFDLSINELLLTTSTFEVTRVDPDIWAKKASKLRTR